ncbi:MAG: hypothetical protein ACKO0M_12540 [Cyanobium sp.]
MAITIPVGIRTECGRAMYLELAARKGLPARVRLAWFVLIATWRDRRLPPAGDAGGRSRDPGTRP